MDVPADCLQSCERWRPVWIAAAALAGYHVMRTQLPL